MFFHDDALVHELSVADVEDHEYALHFVNGRFQKLYTAGKYAFWNVMKNHQFIKADFRNPELSSDIDRSILPKLAPYLIEYQVANYESGLLFYNNVMQKTLAPGRYFFWKGPIAVTVKTVDLRQQQLDMTGQEMMTEDNPRSLSFYVAT